MLIDLHTHSERSDGTDSPDALVRKAHAVGLDVVALTDHDSCAGWSEAAAAATEVGITLVPGLEISCRFAGRGVHLLAYGVDPAYEPLLDELTRILDGRSSRLPAILQRLREVGVDIDVADVRRVSGDAVATGRPHVADALVSLGVVRDRDEAFARYLSPGRPGYVDRYAADLERMLRIVTEAGGVSVIAHPWSRSSRLVLTPEAVARLRDAGLDGIEADHHDHDAAARAELRALADDLGLVRTGSSDYHGTGKVGHDLGSLTTEPEQYERLMAQTVRS